MLSGLPQAPPQRRRSRGSPLESEGTQPSLTEVTESPLTAVIIRTATSVPHLNPITYAPASLPQNSRQAVGRCAVVHLNKHSSTLSRAAPIGTIESMRAGVCPSASMALLLPPSPCAPHHMLQVAQQHITPRLRQSLLSTRRPATSPPHVCRPPLPRLSPDRSDRRPLSNPLA